MVAHASKSQNWGAGGRLIKNARSVLDICQYESSYMGLCLQKTIIVIISNNRIPHPELNNESAFKGFITVASTQDELIR